MKKTAILVLATVATAAAIPAVALYSMQPNDDRVRNVLRGHGYVPLTRPSNSTTIGSLYLIDSGLREFRPICPTAKEDLDGLTVTSRNAEIEQRLQQVGPFVTDIKVDVGPLLASQRALTQNVHFLHANVTEEELPGEADREVVKRLLGREECRKLALQHMRAGEYVCQGLKVVQATMEFMLDRNMQSRLAANGKASSEEINGLVKRAIESHSRNVVEQEGRLLAEAALNYGVTVNEKCLSPPEGRFERVLPRTATRRIVNFILFRIIEPVWPKAEQRSVMAEGAAGHGG